jgi:hypothetical protein
MRKLHGQETAARQAYSGPAEKTSGPGKTNGAGAVRRRAVIHLAEEGQTFIVTPRCLATVKMSLSPRPHMFITMIWSRGSVGASFMTCASA